MRGRDLLLAVLVTALWGLVHPIGKAGVAEVPPLFFTAIRFALTALILVPFLPFPWGRLGDLALLSLTFGGLHFGLLFLGLAQGEASVAAIAVQTNAPFGALLAWLVLGERLGWRRAAGMALAFAGVAVLAGAPSVTGNPLALALVLGAAFSWALANVQIKTMAPLAPLAVSGWVALLAAPQVLAASLVLEAGQLAALAGAGWRGYGALAYTVVVSSAFAYAAWYRLIQRYPVNQVVPFTLLIPVFGVAFSAALLAEPLEPAKLVGGLVTVAGVAAMVLPG
ncbi:MAG: EamA family transporter, partial [Proteobacteria bacterium]|nr:EamA family transporter [Pseudomonadota bacterium]